MAASLCAFVPAAQRALSGRSFPRLMQHVTAGATALLGCLNLAAGMPQLSDQAAFKLAAACSLIFGPGLLVLRQCAQLDALMEAVGTQLSAITAVVARVLLPSLRPQAARAYGSSTAKPAALLPWLAVVSQAVPLISSSDNAGAGQAV